MLSRRRFLGASLGTVVGAPFIKVYARDEPKDQVRLAVIGVAGQGAYNLNQVSHEAVVALCDVDESRANKAREQHPQAKFFTDYRKLYDQVGKEIDAVVIATPDHVHHHAAMLAMNLGKHTYVEKPLARTVGEARQMSELARQKQLVTQLGTQIHAGENYRRVVELVRSGVLGTIHEVDVWVARSPDAGRITKPPEGPFRFDLDQWLGPVPTEFFYTNHGNWPHFHWRWWWAFGGGILADLGCHFMDLAFWALNLCAPETIQAEGTPLAAADNLVPAKMKVIYNFGSVKLTWYHGVQGPSLDGKVTYEGYSNGVRFVGSKGSLIADYGKRLVLPEEFAQSMTIPEPTIAKSIGHHREWLAGIRGEGKPLCNFDYSGNLTEAVLLGNVAYRIGTTIHWDSKRCQVTNTADAGKLIQPEVRPGWEI